LYLSLRHNPVSMERRYRAFETEARARGMRVFHYQSETAAAPDWGVPDWDGEAMRALFRRPVAERPTAVACWADVAAEALLAKWGGHGARVPEDIAVISFDGIPTTSVSSTPHLTTIVAPWRAVARTAVSILAARLEGKEVASETILPVTLRLGSTS